METVVALAFAMGRTLVLVGLKSSAGKAYLMHPIFHELTCVASRLRHRQPPESRMYLINNDKNGQRNAFSFSHFFHMESIHDEHPGLDIISMDEFLRREAVTGRFRSKDGTILLPPGKNRTNFDGETNLIYKYLRSIGHVPVWEPEECLAAFPASVSADDWKHILELNATIQDEKICPSKLR